MKVVKVEEKKIQGISVRTTNLEEDSPDTAKIGALFARFDKNVSVNYKAGCRVHGVYHDYDSDENSGFEVLVGSDQAFSATEKLETVTIEAGNYLLFEGKGEMPQAVVDVWLKVWKYFGGKNVKYQRVFTTDFEIYKNPNEVDVYISIR